MDGSHGFLMGPSIYSFNPFRAAAYLWRSRRVPIVPIPKNTYSLYKGTPSLLARWALPLLSLDVMYMTSMVYECWEGAELYPNVLKNVRMDKPDEAQSTSPNPSTTTVPEPPEKKPISRRLAFGAFHCGLGGLIAVWLLSQRSSWVRAMAVVRPPPSKPKAPARLYIEVSGHPTGYGHPFNMPDCTLMSYHEARNIMLVNTGTEGKFAFYPLGATIGGKVMPAEGDLAKINMLKMWKALGGKIERKY